MQKYTKLYIPNIPNSTKKAFVVIGTKDAAPQIYEIKIVNGDEILKLYMKKSCKRQKSQFSESRKYLWKRVI